MEQENKLKNEEMGYLSEEQEVENTLNIEEENQYVNEEESNVEKEEREEQGENTEGTVETPLKSIETEEGYLGLTEEQQKALEKQKELEERYRRIQEKQDVRDKLKSEMEASVITKDLGFALKTETGEYQSTRKEGTLQIQIVPIDKIKIPKRLRANEEGIVDLAEQIKQFGQLEPITIIPFGDDYVLFSGYRRLQAIRHNGDNEVIAIINTTIPKNFMKYYEVVVNSVKRYTVLEKLEYGKKFKAEQDIGYDLIEGILGMKKGEFLQLLYVEAMQEEFEETYKQVLSEKISIEQGVKKIEKEIAKIEKEKEKEAIDELNSGEMDDELRNKNELMEMQNDAGKQELGERKILDARIRRAVESRDRGQCQCCGYGAGEPDLVGVFNVHHMVAVQYGGSDNKSNLILLCSNCHTLAHDYEKGAFMPEKKTLERLKEVQKIVVLGNMLQKLKKIAITEIKRQYKDTARVLEARKITVGQAIKKHKIDVKGEEIFGGSPYDVYQAYAERIDKGEREEITTNSLAVLSWEDEDTNENENANVDVTEQKEPDEGSYINPLLKNTVEE